MSVRRIAARVVGLLAFVVAGLLALTLSGLVCGGLLALAGGLLALAPPPAELLPADDRPRPLTPSGPPA